MYLSPLSPLRNTKLLPYREGREGAYISLLNQSVPFDDNELFPFAVVPVLSLGYTGLADVDRNLAAILRVYQLRKTAPIVAIHFQFIPEGFLGQISQI